MVPVGEGEGGSLLSDTAFVLQGLHSTQVWWKSGPARSEETAFGEADHLPVADDEVVDEAHVDECERLGEALGEDAVGGAGLRNSRGMSMGNHERAGVVRVRARFVQKCTLSARAVYYGQRGRISAREVYDQMNACSCLTLILACIVYWQAREISRIAAAPDFPFDPELIARVSPIEWKNVILYGEIKIDPDKLRIRGR